MNTPIRPGGDDPAVRGDVGERGDGGLGREQVPRGDPAGQVVIAAGRGQQVVEYRRPQRRVPSGRPGAVALIAAGRQVGFRLVSELTEHPPAGHRELVERGGVPGTRKPQRGADDSDGLHGADIRFVRNVHLPPATPKWPEFTPPASHAHCPVQIGQSRQGLQCGN